MYKALLIYQGLGFGYGLWDMVLRLFYGSDFSCSRNLPMLRHSCILFRLVGVQYPDQVFSSDSSKAVCSSALAQYRVLILFETNNDV